jgi:RNA polymerase sigma factor (sigma-70 family)
LPHVPADSEATAALHRLLGDLALREALRRAHLPARVTTILQDEEFADQTLLTVLLRSHEVEVLLGRMPNVGARSRSAFWNAVVSAVARRGHDTRLSEQELVQLAEALSLDVDRLRHQPQGLLATAGFEDWTTPSGPVSEETLIDLAERALAELGERKRDVVRRRFAVESTDRETLEQVGLDYGVTRERVRQIEKRALAELRRLLPSDALVPLLGRWASVGWRRLAGDAVALPVQGLAARTNALHGNVLLLFELAGMTVEGWLDSVARRYAHGWLAPRLVASTVEATASALSNHPALVRLPRAIASMGESDEVAAALVLILNLYVDGGYVFASRPSPRRRRAATAHALLVRSRAPIQILDLQRAYVAATPGDPCSPRDLLIVMEDARHLFLETADGDWCALGAGGAPPAWPLDEEVEAVFEDDTSDGADASAVICATPETEPTVAGALRDELTRGGPQSIGQLAAKASSILPVGRSVNSIGPTLLGRPEIFVRLLPGVYALPHQIPAPADLVRSSPAYILNEVQARLFTYGRRAEEPWGAFPLWRPEVEMRLCQWARHHAPTEIYSSLLAVAEPDAWPTDLAICAEWRDEKRKRARYDLVASVREDFVNERPPLDRILAALIDVCERGRTSWTRLNRVLGRRIDTHAACGLLAALTALNVIAPPISDDPCPWQLAHRLTGNSSPWRRRLSEELHTWGALSWASPIGREAAEAIRAGADRLPEWVDTRLFTSAYAPVAEQAPLLVEELAADLVREKRIAEFLDWLDAS